MTSEQNALRRDRAALEAELTAAGTTFHGKTCKCPFHTDEHASAGIYQGEDGAWRFKCHGCGFGGDVFDVRANAQGKPLADVLREAAGPSAQRRPTPTPAAPPADGPPPDEAPRIYTLAELRAFRGATEVNEYTDPDSGRIDLITIRLPLPNGGKRFIQARPEGGGLILKRPPDPLPLFNRTRIRAAERLIVTEGEKCVLALHSVGIVATTSPMGAGKAGHADWTPLAGKTAILWPDNDPPGIAHMHDVAAILEKLDPPARLWWIDPAGLGLGPKGDAADFIAALADLPIEQQRAAVEEVLSAATPMGPGRELHDLIEATISGRRRALPWPWSGLGKLTRALLPGTVTLLCGEGGASKSFLILQAAAWWHAEGICVALYELEGTRAEHMQRALAQAAGDARLTDPDWLRANPADARAVEAANAEALDRFGLCIHEAPGEPPDLPALAAWTEAQAKAGAQIIVVDSVTAAATVRDQWVIDQAFIGRAKVILRETGARLLLVAHPRKGHKSAGLDELAGAAAYARLSDTVLWLEWHEPPAKVAVKTALGITTFGVNRTIRILKARHAIGTGARLAFTFDANSLTYREHGIIVKANRAAAADADEEQGQEASA